MKWFIMIIIVVVVAWGSLFITLLNQDGRIGQLTLENKQLIKQNTVETNSIHSQINCVLEFFAQPSTTRSTTSIASPQPCIIKVSP